jgi:hypothetical protein
MFARDEPKPVVSLARADRSNWMQGFRGSESVAIAGNDKDLSDLGDVQDDKVYDHLQQAQMNLKPSDSGDYFQAWKDRMKTPRVTLKAGEFDIPSTPDSPGPTGRHLRKRRIPRSSHLEPRDSHVIPDSRHRTGIASDLSYIETKKHKSSSLDSSKDQGSRYRTPSEDTVRSRVRAVDEPRQVSARPA